MNEHENENDERGEPKGACAPGRPARRGSAAVAVGLALGAAACSGGVEESEATTLVLPPIPADAAEGDSFVYVVDATQAGAARLGARRMTEEEQRLGQQSALLVERYRTASAAGPDVGSYREWLDDNGLVDPSVQAALGGAVAGADHLSDKITFTFDLFGCFAALFQGVPVARFYTGQNYTGTMLCIMGNGPGNIADLRQSDFYHNIHSFDTGTMDAVVSVALFQGSLLPILSTTVPGGVASPDASAGNFNHEGLQFLW